MFRMDSLTYGGEITPLISLISYVNTKGTHLIHGNGKKLNLHKNQ